MWPQYRDYVNRLAQVSPWERQLVLHAKRCLQPMATACGGSGEDVQSRGYVGGSDEDWEAEAVTEADRLSDR